MGSRFASLIRFVTRGIPDTSAEVLGFFRFFYAAFLFVALYQWRLTIDESFISGADRLRFDWIVWVINQPGLVSRLEQALLGLLVLFGIGLFARVAYTLFAAGLTLWILVLVQSGTNIHEWEVAYLTVLCLVPAPWGAALGLDAAIGRWRRRAADPATAHGAGAQRGAVFGYPLWMPGFVLGVVWLGAAYSKIERSGLEWIVGGAVKYHWVIDSPQAAMPGLSLWIASHHWAAVLMSFMGVFLEAAFITAALVRGTVARTVLGASIGGALIGGFYIFHGVLWWTWGLVLISFVVPWEALYRLLTSGVRGVAPASPAYASRSTQVPLRPVTRWQVAMIAFVCLLTIREWPEGIGRFTSYSDTYASTADFDARNPTKPINHVFAGYGTSSATEVFPGSNTADLIIEAMTLLDKGAPLPDSYRTELPRILDDLQQRYGDERGLVTWVVKKRAFDWTQGRFTTAMEQALGTLDLRTGSILE